MKAKPNIALQHPIIVNPIWKWNDVNGAATQNVYGALQPYNKKSKIPSVHERL